MSPEILPKWLYFATFSNWQLLLWWLELLAFSTQSGAKESKLSLACTGLAWAAGSELSLARAPARQTSLPASLSPPAGGASLLSLPQQLARERFSAVQLIVQCLSHSFLVLPLSFLPTAQYWEDSPNCPHSPNLALLGWAGWRWR